MQLRNKTILITGGSSGIGLELARVLIQQQNQVLICGRSLEKLEAAKAEQPSIQLFSCDLADSRQRRDLINWIKSDHPALDILINNAAISHSGPFAAFENALETAKMEVEVNFLAPLQLTEELLPMLDQRPNAALINITTGLVYAPRAEYSFYNATKAALHSFTQVLRQQQGQSSTRIIEVLMPVVDTPWHQVKAPKSAISATEAVQRMLRGIEKGKVEVRVGLVKLLYFISRLSPALASRIINA